MKWETKCIKDIVTEISEGKYVLPVIQRDFVWPEEKIELLFDSVLKEHCFGSIIVIEEPEGNSPLFAFRKFVQDGKNQSKSNPTSLTTSLEKRQFFVIDGQQRLQAFYIGLKGSIGERTLFFDLFSDSQDEYEFDFAEDKALLPVKTDDDRPIKECLWYKVFDLYKELIRTCDSEQTAQEIQEKFQITDELKKEQIKRNVKAFDKNILRIENIGIAVINLNKTKAEQNRVAILELFRRLNNGGTILDNVELMASTLKSFDPKMEAFLRKFTVQFSDIKMDTNNLLKLLFLLQDAPQKDMTMISETDASFALENEERIANTITATKTFLSTAKLADYFTNRNPSFIPLLLIMYYIFHSNRLTKDIPSMWDNYDINNHNFLLIKKWLCESLLNSVFSRGCGWKPEKTGLQKLFNVLKNNKQKDFPYNDLINVYISYPLNNFITSISEQDLDKLNRDFLYYLMYRNQFSFRKNDIDHIMPRSLLEKLNFDPKDINSIKNFQYLDPSTNRGNKNDTPFRKWVNENIKDKDAYLELHLIPTDESSWDEKSFKKFSKARGERIVEKIKKQCGCNN